MSNYSTTRQDRPMFRPQTSYYPQNRTYQPSESSFQRNSSIPPSPAQSATSSDLNQSQYEPRVEIPLQVSYPHGTNPYFRQNLEKHLPRREWSHIDDQASYYPYFKIHLVCYNILAQRLITKNQRLYNNCSTQNLQWDRRRERLYNELLRQNPDIICLQEMQDDHYENDFRPIMAQNGYNSIYLKRSRHNIDGCCLFYKIDRFKLIASKTVPFYHPNIPMLNRDNCGLIALFQPLTRHATPDDLFCVATTHLLFSPSRGDIKLAQLQYFLAEIDRFAAKDVHSNSYYPIIVCGDLNAQLQSPLYQFLIYGSISCSSYRCTEISGQMSTSEIKTRASFPLPSNGLLPLDFVTADCRFPTDTNQQASSILTHNKQFISVYDSNDLSRVTSHINHDSCLVDYIFYTKQDENSGRLRLLSRYELYQSDQVFDIYMPNHQFPSDHFLLAAKFALKLTKTDVG